MWSKLDIFQLLEMPVQKTKEQRVIDALEILRNLKNVGADKDSGYLETKQHIDTWIADGVSWAGKIEFPRYARFAEMILPSRADRKPTFVLRATPELREAESTK
jgi:hypothetical protein